VGAITRRKAEDLQEVSDTIFDLVTQALVKNLDETGCRINDKPRWMHVATTPGLTHYRYSKKLCPRAFDPRGADDPTGFRGIAVHDHWKPYRKIKMKNVTHTLYNVHHLRELQALIEIEKEEWAARMRRLLRRACHAVNLVRDRQNLPSSSCLTRGLTRVPMKPSLIALIDRCYDRIIDDACAWHEALPLLTPKPSGKGRIPPAKAGGRIGHNLALPLGSSPRAMACANSKRGRCGF
jgi:transposase